MSYSTQRLRQIIYDFERDLPKTTKHKRESFTHQIDDFLIYQNRGQTPKIYLEEARVANGSLQMQFTPNNMHF